MFADKGFLSQDPNTISSIASYVDTTDGMDAGLVIHDGHRIVKFSGVWESADDPDFLDFLGEMRELQLRINSFMEQLEEGMSDSGSESLSLDTTVEGNQEQ